MQRKTLLRLLILLMAFSLLAALLIFALKRGLLTSMALVCLASLTISTIGAGDLFSRP